ncbi:MAG: hypothetical protein GXX96_32385 [Planctomycetaceae bacterium]|jgi:hypothetical protein|nr:hypothetical protein [Planctomycetaceae bacterium]
MLAFQFEMEDDGLTQLGDWIRARGTINDYIYTSDDEYGGYEPGGQWYDQEHTKTTLSAILLDVGITQERYELYLERMEALHVKAINKHGASVGFFEASFGMFYGGLIAIDYIPEEDFTDGVKRTIVPDVHEIPTEAEGHYYLPLEGNWYLCYSWYGPFGY